METVQTSVNIITLYPCWSEERWREGMNEWTEEEEKEVKPIQLCDVSVVCINLHTFFEHKKTFFILSAAACEISSRVAFAVDVKTQSKKNFFETRVNVRNEMRRKKMLENIRRGRGFLCFSFISHATTSTPHVFRCIRAKHNFTQKRFASLSSTLSLVRSLARKLHVFTKH